MEGTNYKKGTTTVGVVCKDAVVLAADKRATLGFLVANREVEKIFKVTDRIAMTWAGAAADGQKLANFLKAEMDLYKLSTEVEPSLTVAANLMSNIIFGRAKSFIPYIVQLILGGIDEGKEFALYSLDMAGSSLKEKKFNATGSGSPMAFGVLEDNYKKGITVEQGIELAVRSIASALKRDIGTGEGVNVVVIDNKGFKKIEKEKVVAILKERSIKV